MERGLFEGSESTTALTNVISSGFTPFNLGSIFLLINSNFVAIDLNSTVDLLDLALESSYTHKHVKISVKIRKGIRLQSIDQRNINVE